MNVEAPLHCKVFTCTGACYERLAQLLIEGCSAWRLFRLLKPSSGTVQATSTHGHVRPKHNLVPLGGQQRARISQAAEFRDSQTTYTVTEIKGVMTFARSYKSHVFMSGTESKRLQKQSKPTCIFCNLWIPNYTPPGIQTHLGLYAMHTM
jgi:hypothetical protein